MTEAFTKDVPAFVEARGTKNRNTCVLTGLATAVGHPLFPSVQAYMTQMDGKNRAHNLEKYYYGENGCLPLFWANNFLAIWEEGDKKFHWYRLGLLHYLDGKTLQDLQGKGSSK